jgi:predicted enzyme related to lactoylglutathione lyase
MENSSVVPLRGAGELDERAPAGPTIRPEASPQRGDNVNFNSILIGTEDPESLADYYSNLFGKPAFADGGYTAWQIGNGWITVGPHDEVNGKNAHPGRLIWNIETADVRGEFDRLVAAGAKVVREPYPSDGPDGLIATLSDPDDNYFQLMSPMSMEA